MCFIKYLFQGLDTFNHNNRSCLAPISKRSFFFVYSFQFYDFYLSSEYTFRLCILSGCLYLRLFLIVNRSIVFGSCYLFRMYFLQLLVWKLEIKVLLYLPVSQPPTVTMVLVSIKQVLSSINLLCCFVAQRFSCTM